MKIKKSYQDIINIFGHNGFIIGRMISATKIGYLNRYPEDKVLFNANIIMKSQGKIWHGDLNITKDEEKLNQVAREIGEDLYILSEHDCRFETEKDSIKKLIQRSEYIIKGN